MYVAGAFLAFYIFLALTGHVLLRQLYVPISSVVDPKLFFSDPDPALGIISDPDPACLTKVIRLYLICPQESIAQIFSSHFRRCHCIFVTEKKNCRNSTYRYVLCFLSQKYTSTVMYNETSQLTPGYKYIVDLVLVKFYLVQENHVSAEEEQR